MIKNNVTPQEAIDLLNEILEVDRRAMESLFNMRITCNEKLTEHSSVQVVQVNKNFHLVGILGILNGLFGADEDGWGCITVDLENNNQIKRFRLITKKDKPLK